MKATSPSLGILILLFLADIGLAQQPPARLPNEGKTLQVESVWPGVFFRVSRCERLKSGRLFLKIQAVNPKGSTKPVTLAGGGPDMVVTGTDESGKTFEAERLKAPFSLEEAVLVREDDGSPLALAKPQPGDPYPGAQSRVMDLRPDEAYELGAFFLLPAGGKGWLLLNLRLPQSAGWIKGIPVPQAEGVNVIGKGFAVISAKEFEAAAKHSR